MIEVAFCWILRFYLVELLGDEYVVPREKYFQLPLGYEIFSQDWSANFLIFWLQEGKGCVNLIVLPCCLGSWWRALDLAAVNLSFSRHE